MNGPKPTVLVVDDAPENITIAAGALSERFRVRAATTGAHAMTICRSADPPLVVLLDVVMPEMDGLEVCRRLKADPATSSIPVIFVTGQSAEAEVDQCLALGAADCVSKPVHAGLLLRRVEAQAELVRARRRLAEQGSG